MVEEICVECQAKLVHDTGGMDFLPVELVEVALKHSLPIKAFDHLVCREGHCKVWVIREQYRTDLPGEAAVEYIETA